MQSFCNHSSLFEIEKRGVAHLNMRVAHAGGSNRRGGRHRRPASPHSSGTAASDAVQLGLEGEHDQRRWRKEE